MCDPVTLGVISVGMSVMGAIQQSKAQKSQANYQSQVARNNQVIAERNAVEIEQQGEKQAVRQEDAGRLEANRLRARVRQVQSEQLVSMAGQGGDVTVGNNVDLFAETAAFGELDAQTINHNAELNAYDTRYTANRNAYNARVEGMNLGSQAGLYDAQAKAERPLMAGLTTGLSGAASVASKWQLSKTSAGGGSGSGLNLAPQWS